MADSVIVPAVKWLFSLLIQNRLYGVEDRVNELQQELENMQGYLQDADAIREEGEVRNLISQIRKLAYDAEDVIDTYIIKVGVRVQGRWYRRYTCLVYNSPHIYQVVNQIERIQNDLSKIEKKFIGIGVRKERGTRSFRGDGKMVRSKSYPYDDPDGECFVGLEKDLTTLVEVLMSEGNQQIRVVAIVGMGGSGKTTLARKLYNHPYTTECFDCMAWVCVSQEWSTSHVLSQILKKVSGPSGEMMTYTEWNKEELVDKLHNILREKSFLVVLDDVWRREALEDIFPALPRGDVKRGSKIIITTRNRDILPSLPWQNSIHSMHIHEPQPLSDEEAWVLFSKLALSNQQLTSGNMNSFERLGKDMLQKCDGLPLAIVALAGILNRKDSIGAWHHVKEAVRSRVMDGTGTNMYGRVGDMLALSYDDLPYALKPCFLYLGLFPDDCQISTGMLTRMWIAEGLVTAHQDRSPEDEATHHLEELSHRFMIQVARTNFKEEIKAIRLHDLLHDLCVKKAREQSFLDIFHGPGTSNASELAIQPRRAALHSSVSLPTQVSHLRSVVLLPRSIISFSAYDNKEMVAYGKKKDKEMLDLRIVHRNFKLLRLLCLWGVTTVDGFLPKEIGSLVHLRYLEIRATNIIELPKSVGKLRNLLTLDYRNIDLVDDSTIPIKFPYNLSNLILLKHLFLPVEFLWKVDDQLKLSAMKDLQTLWGVKQDAGGVWLSREVPKLSTTLKKLKIEVSTGRDLEAAFTCPSLVSDVLQTFHLEMKEGIAIRNMNVFSLSRCHHLLKLILIGEVQMELSVLLPNNLVILELKNSVLQGANFMEALESMAHLKCLRLSNSYMGTTLTSKSISFPRLEEFYLGSFHNLGMWRIERGAMPCLRKLEITACWQFKKFPEGLKFVTTLKQLDFFDMPPSFCQKAFECGWSQRLKLPHNCEAIVRHADSPVDFSSIRKLHEQLTAGVLLNDRKQKYWITSQGGFYNCFMVYPRDLTISWGDKQEHWQWNEVIDRDGKQITTAELLWVSWLDIKGTFDTSNLSPRVTYEVAYEIMLKNTARGWINRLINFKLTLPDGSIQTNHQILHRMPREQWFLVTVGEFEINPGNMGNIKFALYTNEKNENDKSGLVIKGVIIDQLLWPVSAHQLWPKL